MIRSGTVSSQEDVTAKLAEQGIAVTQATVSRDLDQMGAVKVKRGGVLGYALPDQMADNDWAASRLQRILADWVQSVEAAGQLIVMKTPPRSEEHPPDLQSLMGNSYTACCLKKQKHKISKEQII